MLNLKLLGAFRLKLCYSTTLSLLLFRKCVFLCACVSALLGIDPVLATSSHIMDFAAMMKAEKARDAAERLIEIEKARTIRKNFCHLPELPVLVDLGHGIRYCDAFLSATEAAELVVAIDQQPAGAWHTLTQRRLLNLGGVPHPSGSWSEPLPETITGLVTSRLVAMGVFEDSPDQAKT